MSKNAFFVILITVFVALCLGGVSCNVGRDIGYRAAVIEWVGPDSKDANGKYYINGTKIMRSETKHIIYEYYVPSMLER